MFAVASRPARIAALTVLVLGGSPAHALSFFDEITLYLTSGSFTPGATASTTFTFGSKPAVDLSAFDFQLSWDNALATPVASGAGSVAAWAELLGAKGSVSLDFSAPQVIKGRWTADPVGGASNWINTDYSHPVQPLFSFDTSSSLNAPFVVRMELTNIKNSAGDAMDTGSGFFNTGTLSPVPEPSAWLGMMGGLAALGAWRRRGLERR